MSKKLFEVNTGCSTQNTGCSTQNTGVQDFNFYCKMKEIPLKSSKVANLIGIYYLHKTDSKKLIFGHLMVIEASRVQRNWFLQKFIGTNRF